MALPVTQPVDLPSTRLHSDQNNTTGLTAISLLYPLPSDHIQFAVGSDLLTIEPALLPSIPHLQTLLTSLLPVQRTSSGLVSLCTGPDGAPIHPLYVRLIIHHLRTAQPRHLLSKLPSRSDPLALIKLWDYLCMPQSNLSLRSLHTRLRDLRDTARNAAVELSLGVIRGTYDLTDRQVTINLFSEVLWIVSQPGIFGRRMRWHVCRVFVALCTFSRRQMARLEELARTDRRRSASTAGSFSDSTSAEDQLEFFGSAHEYIEGMYDSD